MHARMQSWKLLENNYLLKFELRLMEIIAAFTAALHGCSLLLFNNSDVCLLKIPTFHRVRSNLRCESLKILPQNLG